jgi:hypothetical protein
MKLLTFENYVKSLHGNLIIEGGAYGHLKHPFEDMDLTMGDIEDMINSTVEGSFGPENFVSEKTDGQQLSISWKNGKIIAARNKSHLKNKGEAALDIKGISDLFKDRGDIEKVYNAAMQDLTKSIGALSESDKKKYFANGKKFASLEIITPVTQNTVPYGLNMLVFHGVLEYDDLGNVIDEDRQAGRDLGKLIANANAEAQETFFVRGPQDMDVKPFPNTQKRKEYYISKLKKIIKENNLTEKSTVLDYAIGSAARIITKRAKQDDVNLPSASLQGLAKRISDIDKKGYSISQIKKDLGQNAEWYLNLEKDEGKKLKSEVYEDLESLFLEIGTEFMKNMSAFLSANPTKAAEEMRKEIENTISQIRKSGDVDDVQKLEKQLKRLTSAGGLESIVPTEGITFVYKGKLYKYTGIFAPLHQIRSILAYKK